MLIIIGNLRHLPNLKYSRMVTQTGFVELLALAPVTDKIKDRRTGPNLAKWNECELCPNKSQQTSER